MEHSPLIPHLSSRLVSSRLVSRLVSYLFPSPISCLFSPPLLHLSFHPLLSLLVSSSLCSLSPLATAFPPSPSVAFATGPGAKAVWADGLCRHHTRRMVTHIGTVVTVIQRKGEGESDAKEKKILNTTASVAHTSMSRSSLCCLL